MIAENLIEEMLPHLAMLGFKKLKPGYSDVYEGGVDTELQSNDGWTIKFYIQANFIDLLNQEDNFGKRVPLGKNSLKLLIKAIEDQDNDS